MKKILVTGGAGYIGSHTCVELLKNGYEVVVIDNLCNSMKEAIKRVEKIAGKNIVFYDSDIRDKQCLKNIFSQNKIDAVLHFAGLKSVGESCKKPLEYYDSNVYGTIVLCEIMKEFGVKNLVFSSSATVYGENTVPYNETMSRGRITNPYGKTKAMIEEILEDLQKSDNDFNISILRYFNPIGAHESGLIGENPVGVPNNIMPYISQVACGKLSKLTVFGNDYDTKDGTCIRDYIHVVDLAKGHIKALKRLFEKGGISKYNLGTGKGYSVLELIEAFEKASGVKVKYEFGKRRSGDIAMCYASVEKAKEELDWEAEYGIIKMCEDSWNWQKNNPNGYLKTV